MTLSEFVALIKRRTQIGNVADTTDRTTADIILYINNGLFKIWRKWPWDWSAEDISLALTIDENDYTLASTIGQISELYVSGQTDPLIHVTRKEYLKWILTNPESAGTPTHYMKTGRNSSGNLKIRVSPTSSAAGTILGWGKTRIVKLSVASIAAGTAIPFVPEEAHDVLFNYVLADALHSKGDKADAATFRLLADNDLIDLIRTEEAQPDETISTPPPDAYRFKKRNRGGTQVA